MSDLKQERSRLRPSCDQQSESANFVSKSPKSEEQPVTLAANLDL
jgi:hypothetical protein